MKFFWLLFFYLNPLILAIRKHSIEIIRLLLTNKNIDFKQTYNIDLNKATPIKYAFMVNDFEIIRILLSDPRASDE